MARREHDREDLLAEAVALVPRIELEVMSGSGRTVDVAGVAEDDAAAGCAGAGVPRSASAARGAADSEHIVIGFRDSACGSVYFGQDEAYHFNAAGELRRAYRDGRLYKAERGRMVSLTRQRGPTQTVLLRATLAAADEASFLARLRDQMSRLQSVLAAGRYRVIGCVNDARPSDVGPVVATDTLSPADQPTGEPGADPAVRGQATAQVLLRVQRWLTGLPAGAIAARPHAL